MSLDLASSTATLTPDGSGEAVSGCDAGLSLDEAIELKQLEGEIEKGLRHFAAVGNALGAIRDRRLYSPAYPTFEDYCERRWQIARRTAYQYIDGAEVFENVRHGAQTAPANERQVRALSAIKDPEQQREAWSKVVETAPDGRITAKHVADIVREFQGEPEPPAEPAPLTIHEAIGLLRPRVYEVFSRWPSGQLAVLAQQLRDLAHELETNGELCP